MACDRQSFDADVDSPITVSNAMMLQRSPPPVPPVTPSIMHELEFSGELPSSDSKHLMKPLAERLRRLSTGSMNVEVHSRPVPTPDTRHVIASSSTTGAGFRKCMN